MGFRRVLMAAAFAASACAAPMTEIGTRDVVGMVPLGGALTRRHSINCPGQVGRCLRFDVVAEHAGSVTLELAMTEPVRFAAHKTIRMGTRYDTAEVKSRTVSATRQTYSWQAKADVIYTLRVQIFDAKAEEVGYQLNLRGLKVVRRHATFEPIATDWKLEHEKLLAAAPRADMLREQLPRTVRFDGVGWKRETTHTLGAEGVFRYRMWGHKGTCYTVNARLNGRWSPEAQRARRAHLIYPDGSRFVTWGWAWFHRGGIKFGPICPNQDGTLTIVMRGDERSMAPWANKVAEGTWQLQVWSQPSDPFARNREALGALVKLRTNGFRKIRDYGPSRLDEPVVVDAPVRARQCYLAVMRLEEGATWWQVTKKAGNVTGKHWAGGTTSWGGPGVVGPGGVWEVGCFLVAAPGHLTFEVGRNEGLGRGLYTIELFEKEMPVREVADEQSDLRAHGQTMADVVARAKWETCRYCGLRRGLCRREKRPDCDDVFDACAAEGNVSSGFCRTRKRPH